MDATNPNSNHMTRFITDSALQRGLTKMSVGKHVFNLSSCLLKPKCINLVLSGFNSTFNSIQNYKSKYGTLLPYFKRSMKISQKSD